jgi:hypothetical protein
MEIAIYKNKLFCLPFGSKTNGPVYLKFDEFKPENEDVLGWWHLSCSYSYKGEMWASLSNEYIIEASKNKKVGRKATLPSGYYKGQFG